MGLDRLDRLDRLDWLRVGAPGDVGNPPAVLLESGGPVLLESGGLLLLEDDDG
jgi:hypothetical protein